ncbi:MAG: chemotaxis protein CheB [Spongiibacteraceae bacterium]
MNDRVAPSLGVVAATDLARHVLRTLLVEAGYRIDYCIAPQRLAAVLSAERAPDAWLLDATASDDDELLVHIAEGDAPFLILDEEPPLHAAEELAVWSRRLLDKIEELTGSIGRQRLREPAPLAVWVLAASTGGPAAVNEFLQALAPGLPVAFVYAQHIEAPFDTVLTASLARRHLHYPALLGEGEQLLRRSQILVVPVRAQLRFLPFHRVVASRHPWQGQYQPAIDQVVAEVARLYQNRCGVIVFSGLCDDGAFGCRRVRAVGGSIWVQTPDSCTSPDMPNAALATGTVSRRGTPTELAQAFGELYGNTRAVG